MYGQILCIEYDKRVTKQIKFIDIVCHKNVTQTSWFRDTMHIKKFPIVLK
jgi:hypothetical protein